MKHIQRQIEPLSSILSLLPIHERKMLEKQFLETSITTKFISNAKYHDLIPREGSISWIIGSEGNHIPQSLLQTGSYAVMLAKPVATQFIDFTCNSIQGKSTYRFDHIVESHIERCKGLNADETMQAAVLGQKILHNNLNAWTKIFDLWKKHSQVSFHKSPTKFGNEKSLFVSFNPRKNICNELIDKALKGGRVIIGDSECETSFDICSRKHFDLDSRERSIKTIRNILAVTDKIMEQRVIYLEEANQHYLLCRNATISKEMANAAKDETNGLKEIMSEVTRSMLSWKDVALQLSKEQGLDKESVDRLLVKAGRLDMNSSKLLSRFKLNESQNLTFEIASS